MRARRSHSSNANAPIVADRLPLERQPNTNAITIRIRRSTVAWMMSATPRPITTADDSHGHRPEPVDDEALLLGQRDRNAVFMNPNAIVTIGVSLFAASSSGTDVNQGSYGLAGPNDVAQS
jgi:hypothetical protein